MLYYDHARKIIFAKNLLFFYHLPLSCILKNGQHLENKDSFLLHSHLVSHAFLLWTQIPSAVC